MREVFAKLGEDIRLGRRGENLATRVTFDVSGWMSSGDGTINLLHQRNGDNEPYLCAITVDGGTVMWTITAADVEIAGRGRAELQYLDGDVCKKSAIYTTNTLRSLNRAGEVPPEPHKGWVHQVMEAKAAVDTAASDAQESAGTAESFAGEAKTSAENAYDSALTAGACLLNTESYMQKAQSAAQTAAVDAANAAAPLAAQQAVANAENQLASYCDSAESSAQNAESSADDARGAAEQAQTSATSAGMAVDDAQKAAGNALNEKVLAEKAAEMAGRAYERASTEAGRAETAAEQAQADATRAEEAAELADARVAEAQRQATWAEKAAENAEEAATQAQTEANRAVEAAERAEAVVSQPDWNQDDKTAADYIKNKPVRYGETLVPLLPETTVYIDAGEMYQVVLPVDFEFDDGERYLVEWNGIQYWCHGAVYGNGTNAGVVLAPCEMRTYFGSGELIIWGNEEGNATISISHETRAALFDETYIPNTIARTAYVHEQIKSHRHSWNDLTDKPYDDGTVTILPETSINITAEDMFEAILPVDFVLEEGETYIVKWNGIEYECVGTTTPWGGDRIELVTDTFEIYSYPGYINIYGMEEGRVTVSISHKTIVLRPEYAEAIKNAMPSEEWTFVLEDGTTVTKQVMVK